MTDLETRLSATLRSLIGEVNGYDFKSVGWSAPNTDGGEEILAEIAARKEGWQHGGDNGGFIFDGQRFGSWKEAASSNDAATYATWQECCNGEDIQF